MRRPFWRRASALLATAGLLATVSACGSESGEADGIQLVQADTLTVCTHLPYKPFQFEQDGEVVGFEKDILDLLANELGVEQAVKNLAWESIVSGKAFDNEACDVGMGAMTITDERAEALAITEPYFDATQVLVAEKGSGYESLDELEDEPLGVQTDTTGQIYVEDQGLEPKRFDDLSLQLNALKAGEIEAAVNDNGVVLDWLQDNPDFEITTEFDTDEQYGFPAKDDENGREITERLDRVIEQAKEDGSYAEIHEKWFGVEPDESPAS